MEEKPTYYAIIPANVRYDSELKANEKLLYGEITALSSKEGYCWATNAYFSELYGVSKQSISTWINHLKERGYVDIEFEYKGKEIVNRKISLIPLQENLMGGIEENLKTPLQENLKENNTRANTTSKNNKKEYTGKFVPPTLEEVETYVKEKGLSVSPSGFYNYFTEGNWIDSKGNKVKSWKQKLLTWENMRKPAEKKQIGEVL